MKLPKTLPAWFTLSNWRNDQRRAEIGHDYLGLRQMPALLADIAVRGRVFSAFDPSQSVDYQNGRRELALEIIALTTIDVQVIQRICFEPINRPEKPR